MRTQCKRRDGRSGQTLLMVTLALIPMFGIMGMVTDFGYMHFVKMEAQTAAEAAARAAIIDLHATLGGSALSCGGNVVCATNPTNCTANISNPTNSIDRGCMYAQQHGFNSTGKTLVTYQSGVASVPPTASGSSSASYWVIYRAIERVPQMFSAVLGNTSGLVVGRSTAAVVGASDCIYAMDKHASPAISVGGTASLTSSCGIWDNSDAGIALSTNGTATLSAPEYDVVGGVSTHNPLSPAANTGVSQTTDPLAGLAAPASTPYTCNALTTSGHGYTVNTNGPPVVLQPGTYCGGIFVKKGTAQFSAGTYILDGGGLGTQDANSVIDASAGVLIYNTFDSSNAYAPISIAATSNVTMDAGTTGVYAGILFFEDRNAPASADTYGGGSSAVYQGVIYALNAAVTMYGNSSVNTQYTLMVCDTLSLVGTSAFNDNYSSLPNGSPIQKIVLVE